MFNELKVLELASVLAGPSVGQFFAELGAEVIKVENVKTGGDVTRTWKSADEQTDDRSAYFCSVNWGKKSIALDLTSDEGKIIVQKLTAQADIIIASYKPGDAEKLGVDYKQLVAARGSSPFGGQGAARGLIYGQISGYGSDNDRVGYDAVLQAESGFMDLNGEKNGPPTKMPVALIDVLAGHQLKEGLLLALLNRERTGKGCLVEVSLIETAVSSLVNQASNWLVANKLPSRQGSLHPNIADGNRVLLAIGSDRQFQDLCEILGLSPDSHFATNQLRVQNRTELAELLKPLFQSRRANELMEKIHRKKIPAGIIQTVQEALAMPDVHDTFLTASNLQGIRGFVAHFTDAPSRESGNKILPPPHFGEHTEAIIDSLQ
jgi:crotonobetainyl-CoA:carnitine CoA-transferase CaiB-like acyl-CoA transferase